MKTISERNTLNGNIDLEINHNLTFNRNISPDRVFKIVKNKNHRQIYYPEEIASSSPNHENNRHLSNLEISQAYRFRNANPKSKIDANSNQDPKHTSKMNQISTSPMDDTSGLSSPLNEETFSINSDSSEDHLHRPDFETHQFQQNYRYEQFNHSSNQYMHGEDYHLQNEVVPNYDPRSLRFRVQRAPNMNRVENAPYPASYLNYGGRNRDYKNLGRRRKFNNMESIMHQQTREGQGSRYKIGVSSFRSSSQEQRHVSKNRQNESKTQLKKEEIRYRNIKNGNGQDSHNETDIRRNSQELKDQSENSNRLNILSVPKISNNPTNLKHSESYAQFKAVSGHSAKTHSQLSKSHSQSHYSLKHATESTRPTTRYQWSTQRSHHHKHRLPPEGFLSEHLSNQKPFSPLKPFKGLTARPFTGIRRFKNQHNCPSPSQFWESSKSPTRRDKILKSRARNQILQMEDKQASLRERHVGGTDLEEGETLEEGRSGYGARSWSEFDDDINDMDLLDQQGIGWLMRGNRG